MRWALLLLLSLTLPSPSQALKKTLAWDRVQTCVDQSACFPDTYTIYRRTQEAPEFLPLATVHAPTVAYTDKHVAAGLVSYYVTAENTINGESSPSNIVSLRLRDLLLLRTQALKAPTAPTPLVIAPETTTQVQLYPAQSTPGRLTLIVELEPDDTKTMDQELATLIKPLLAQVQGMAGAVPRDVKNAREWQRLLAKMVWSMQALIDGKTGQVERMQEGIDLYHQYFGAPE